MEKEILKNIEPSLKTEGINVIKVYTGVENGKNTIYVVIDSNKVVDINMCVKATKIINPLLDSMNYDFSDYVIDVCSKGEENE